MIFNSYKPDFTFVRTHSRCIHIEPDSVGAPSGAKKLDVSQIPITAEATPKNSTASQTHDQGLIPSCIQTKTVKLR